MAESKIKEKFWDKAFEPAIYNEWKANGSYAFKKKKGKKVFSIDTPPPYVNTPVHLGQVTTYVLMDMFARFHRMIGDNVLFPLGLDRNGLPIEMAAEKEFEVKLTSLPREKALEMCEKILEKASMASVESFLRCGIAFNSLNVGTALGEVYHTDSADYRALTQETFIDLWNKGLIYEDTRINNWCPGCQTTLADAEVIYEDLQSDFNDIIFKVKETNEAIVIGTTRPELVATCGMVIFNPADERYKHLEGKTAITPIFNREVPIKAHPLAEIEKGTGLVMMCSAGDLSDIRFFREMRIKPVIAINKDGTMNENASFLTGLKVEHARKAMIERLKKEDLLVRQKQVTHRTPICERSKDQIEFIEMTELYLKQIEYKKKMQELAHKLNFFSPKSRQILLDWIESVSIDWPISRRRFYATEIPMWYCEKCKTPFVPERAKKPKYYRPWKEEPPINQCPKCKHTKFKGEDRVFDTWFDSSITPLYIMKWARDDKFFDENAPCTLRPQGKEIVRTWLYYTLLKCNMLTGKLIFSDAWINYHIVDENGNKMSKSAGNSIDPKEVLDKFGAEPFRLWAAIEGNLDSTDFRCSFDRIAGAGKTLTKLWNVAKFVSMFEPPEAKAKLKLTELDKWIVQELNSIVKLARESYEKYDFHNPATSLKHFIWETFASHYLELVKGRAYNSEGNWTKEEQNAAISTLHNCLETVLKLLAPILPLMTYKIYNELQGKDIHFEKFPEVGKEQKISFKTEELVELNGIIWKAKKDKGLSLKAEISKATVPEQFKAIEKELRQAHSIKELNFGKKTEIGL